MIKFAAICPHPPIIIPGIGKEEDLDMAKNTINAMKKLSLEIEKKNIDTVIIISPHGTIYPDRMNIAYGGEFSGDFSQFGLEEVNFDFSSDDSLARKIIQAADEEGINTNPYTENEALDHGVLVPMYYLREHLHENVKIIPINYSMLPAETHFNFGQIISQIVSSDGFKQKNIAIIASGDMSHRLFNDIDSTFENAGKSFDHRIVSDIKENNVLDILEYDEDWLDAAGECGYRSILILLGALSAGKYTPHVLSYEGPFGVGYLVADFKINN